MNKEELDDILNSYTFLKKEINEMQKTLDEEIYTLKQANISQPQKQINQDYNYTNPCFHKTSNVENLKEIYVCKINRKKYILNEIESLIDKITSPKIRVLFRQKYIEGLSNKSIAKKNYYSRQHVDRLLRFGKNEILKSIENNYL